MAAPTRASRLPPPPPPPHFFCHLFAFTAHCTLPCAPRSRCRRHHHRPRAAAAAPPAPSHASPCPAAGCGRSRLMPRLYRKTTPDDRQVTWHECAYTGTYRPVPLLVRVADSLQRRHEVAHGGVLKRRNYTRHVTCHTSHVTRHTSHVTRHTSHVTRHTLPSAL
jgi:hypothetical protein